MIIYIIDDTETNLDLFQAIVRKVDTMLEPVCFTDPLEALEACSKRMPDIVAVDYMMPEIDGHEFVRRFHALPESQAIPVVMITAAIERHVRRTALDLGVSDFLTKPIDPYETRARLKTLVALRHSYLQMQDHGRLLAEEVQKATRTILERERGLKLGLVIADAANQNGSMYDIIRFALEEICNFTGWEVGMAFFIEDSSLPPAAVWHGSSEQATEAGRRLTEIALTQEALVARVVGKHETQWTDELAATSACSQEAAAAACGFTASCAFPVFTGPAVAAVLQFFATRPVALDKSRLDLLAQVGMQLGRVIERARAEQSLVFNATHDSLTQLPNRGLFIERLQQAIASFKRDATHQFAVLFIDLDRFKVVNDSLGHLAGDDLLIEVAARMKACVRKSDTVMYEDDVDLGESGVLARMGGDEFTILLDKVQDPSDSLRVANRIQQSLQKPFIIAGQEVYTGASIGITLSSTAYETGADVLRDADLAMYRAKSLGKGRSEIFDQAMHEAAMIRLTMEADLRRALREQEFILYYQPIVDLTTQQVEGFEALVRWQTPEGEIIPPAQFIPLAEETGLIVFLGAWVLRQACLTLREWDIAFPDRKLVSMSVNVSPREFSEGGFVNQVERILRETGVAPERVRLEITESATMGDAEQSVKLLSQLRALGVQLSVDDFGIGYSSLSYLHRFPLNILKIDRCFVKGLGENAESREVITSIVGLARSMGLKVVAEGAEDDSQIEVLRNLGCDFGQGFIFHHPLDAAGAKHLLRARGLEQIEVPPEAVLLTK